jgi:Tfp pilus assembly PilM family ATPase
MKIVNQSSDELVLKEGSATGIAIGAALVVAGVLVEIFLRPSRPVALWIGLALVAVGIAVILLSSSITVIANKTKGQLFYEKKRLIGGQNYTYAIADIFRIETRRQWQTQNTGPTNQGEPPTPQQVLVAQSVIVFKDGRELALDHQKTSSSTSVGGVVLMGGQGAEVALAAKVANFMNVPFQEISPPNMGMGLNIQF